jgi:hypothetical protein
MKKQNTPKRIFEVMARLDKTFKPKMNEEFVGIGAEGQNLNTTPIQQAGMKPEVNEAPRPLSQIAREIRSNWNRQTSGTDLYFGAEPYLEAMESLNSINDMYGMDSAKSVVLYFLANAQTWRGETAKRIKAELKGLAGLRESIFDDKDDDINVQ